MTTATATGTTMTITKAKAGLPKGTHQKGRLSNPLQVMKSGRPPPAASSLRYIAIT